MQYLSYKFYSKKATWIITAILAVLFSLNNIHAQQFYSLSDCIRIATENNPSVKIASLEIVKNKQLEKTAFNPGKTDIRLNQSPIEGASPDNSIGISQSFDFPTVYTRERKLLKQQTLLAEKQKDVNVNELVRDVKMAYYDVLYILHRKRLLGQQDSLYNDFLRIATLRFKAGESSQLEPLTANAKLQEINLQLQQAVADETVAMQELQRLMNTNEHVRLNESEWGKLPAGYLQDTSLVAENPVLAYSKQQVNVAEASVSAEKSKMLPGITLGYQNQFIIKGFNPGDIDKSYTPYTKVAGLELGISVPIFSIGAQKAKINAGKTAQQSALEDVYRVSANLKTAFSQQYVQYQQQTKALNYYETTGLAQANELKKATQLGYSKGEIDYVEYVQNVSQAINTELQYMDGVNRYNRLVIQLNYLVGNK